MSSVCPDAASQHLFPGVAMSDKAVIFDMDGVLVDSYQPHYESTRITCERRGFPLEEETFNQLFGRSFDSFAHAIAGSDISAAAIQAWYWEKEGLYRQLIAEDFPAMDGAPELLRALADAGFRLAIGSSGPRENVDYVVEHLPGANLFQETVCGDEVSHGKPAPDVFLLAAKKLGVDPSRCVVVEDSIHGLVAAKTAGMPCLGLTGTANLLELKAKAALVVNSLCDLTPEIFDHIISRHRPSGRLRASRRISARHRRLSS